MVGGCDSSQTVIHVSGSDGIELKFSDRSRIVRIGTKDSTKLKDEIIKRLKKEKTPKMPTTPNPGIPVS